VNIGLGVFYLCRKACYILWIYASLLWRESYVLALDSDATRVTGKTVHQLDVLDKIYAVP